MTSVDSMRVRRAGLAVAAAAALLPACARQEAPLVAPWEHRSPYSDQTVWAVSPFFNESGVSRIDPARVSDLFTYEVEQVRGINTIPVNRVVRAQQALGLGAITNDAEARAVLALLGADGLVMGTITAYDPYRPMQLGLAVRLVTRDRGDDRALDVRAITRSPAGDAPPDGRPAMAAEASGLFDASNHAVQQRLQSYAAGRAEPDSAYGERIYEVSMELYTRFVSHELIGDLLAAEHHRLIANATDTDG